MSNNIFSGKEFSAEVGRIINVLNQESDRGAVLVASSMIEVALKNLIATYLLPSPNKKKDDLLEGPLANFNSRILAAYRLGLIRPSIAESLQLFRSIRNVFAHSIETCDFESDSFKGTISKIYSLDEYISDILDGYGKNHDGGILPIRLKFILFFSIVVAALNFVKSEVNPIKPLDLIQ